MELTTAVGLTSIVFLGIGAQWLAWRLRLPAILLLLLSGFVAGPITGFINPDELFGDLLFPVVSLSVGLILFEGGLSLRLDELRTIGRPLRNLVIVGAAVSWFVSTAAAYVFLGIDFNVSLLLGAILVVTGPTVIGPLLRQIRPKEPVNSILKWEGILIDPIGATLALLVFEAIQHTGSGDAALTITAAILKTIVLGSVLGVAGGAAFAIMLQRYWIPDFLQNAVAMMFVLTIFSLSNLLQHESGLLAVTVMGIYLANQRRAEVQHIVEFKETLRVLLISGLFIVLAARLQFSDLLGLPLPSLLFLATVILVARPLSVFASTWRTNLTIRDKAFLSWMAPRGIVAASVSSVFTLRLVESGHTGAELVAPATFLTIVGTVCLYGLTAGPVARRLDVAQPNPSGLVFLSGPPWARALANTLKTAGVNVLIADINRTNISAARMDGLRVYHGNILSDHGTDSANLSGTGGFLALTPNSDTNSLACKHFEAIFGRARVFQLAAAPRSGKREQPRPRHLRGRYLFGPEITYSALEQRFEAGARFKRTSLTKDFTFDSFKEHYGDDAIPLMVITREGVPVPLTVEEPLKPAPGHVLVSLVDPEPAEPAQTSES